MKKSIIQFLMLLAVSVSCVAEPTPMTFFIDAGILANKDGIGISDGSLVLLIASPTGSGFSNSVDEGNYVGGDSLVIGAFGLASINEPSEAFKTLSSVSVELGYKLAIRWFPDVTADNYINPLFPQQPDYITGHMLVPQQEVQITVIPG